VIDRINLNMNKYRTDFSNKSEEMYNKKSREIKAKKIISVLSHNLDDTSELKLLDIGCSTGIMTKQFALFFKNVVGLDVDEQAIKFAKSNYEDKNLIFINKSIEDAKIEDNFFDVVVLSHVIQLIPDLENFLSEVSRIIKPGGVCYLAAGNRLSLRDPQYNLLFLSLLPKSIGNFYIKLFRDENDYFETNYSLMQLKKFVKNFEIIDYTLKIISSPNKFSASDVIKEGSVKHKVLKFFSKTFYFLIPTYIWVLKKPNYH